MNQPTWAKENLAKVEVLDKLAHTDEDRHRLHYKYMIDPEFHAIVNIAAILVVRVKKLEQELAKVNEPWKVDR